uniref:Uncharacterized protein n=1 Tax=Tetraselmis chuii TaxID=63592 RepID=A0A7S1SN88_9CHLO|mmetsp:Transcript_16800/g.29954  ORF Transcript_16800/g.29954 Transcript_16800/m.29954 type:complete len:121 (+) Transcript_16800:209-571(+)|eukprot:CAMPEP_0177763136 /NCGR_PEP_ID=MMETSP0491_2-20121128/6713_1 /TAXON_ID=63592 /ORGANISM="Tetraselmis chuii, Strain PLY429" /LENGTH=120 /DNA_ID=CAMNT_0019279229 /DNA_START=189 /DNA_END=551 /DNA_ORIENTATION=+
MTRSSWYWRDSGEALQQRWRRVASTHCLSDLAQDEGADTLQRSMGTALLGLHLLGISAIVLVFGLFAVMGSKLAPPFEHPVLKAIQEDTYYCLLVPMTLPVTVIAVIVNWISMKLFKHNS